MQSEICKSLLEARELGGSLTQIYILKFLRFEAERSSLESRKMIEFAINLSSACRRLLGSSGTRNTRYLVSKI
jgi:hypothetical protein